MAEQRPSPPPRGSGAGPELSWTPRAAGLQSQPQLRSPASAGSQKAPSPAIGASPSRHGSPPPRTPWQRSVSPRPMAHATGGLSPAQHSPRQVPEVAKAAPVAASAALHSSPPVVPKQTVASSGASMAAGDDIARIDSLPPTPPETVVASAARTLPEHRSHPHTCSAYCEESSGRGGTGR